MVFRPGHAAQALMHDTNLSFCMHKLTHRRNRAALHRPPTAQQPARNLLWERSHGRYSCVSDASRKAISAGGDVKKPRQSLTIVDIAQLAGVSKSTASRALSGATNISAETRERVHAVAEKHGYQRNHLAQSLRNGRSGMIGLIIPDIANPFWADVARGAQDAAGQNGTIVLIFNSDWDPERERQHMRALIKARVDGVIVNPVHDIIDEVTRFDIPAVLIGSSAIRFPALPSVGSDIVQGVRLGLDLLFARGFTAPAILLGQGPRQARETFINAVGRYFQAHGRSLDGLIIEDSAYSVAAGRAAMARVLHRAGAGPLAVFANNDQMALGALLAVRDAGLRCPQDVSVLGIDGTPAGEFSEPGLTTVVKPARQIGARAMQLLERAIAGEAGNDHVLLACELELRGSLGVASAVAATGAALAHVGNHA